MVRKDHDAEIVVICKAFKQSADDKFVYQFD